LPPLRNISLCFTDFRGVCTARLASGYASSGSLSRCEVFGVFQISVSLIA
jgi:hypothetical protein